MKATILAGCLFVCIYASCQHGITEKAVSTDDTVYRYRSPSSGGTGKFYFGREIARIMDASGSDWLERPSRPNEENTELIVESMNLNPDMVVADIGAGTGYYTYRIAKRVPHGKVYAVEIQDEMIEMLNKKKNEIAAKNVEVVRGDTMNVNLQRKTVDLAILVDVYHELSWPREIIQSIGRSLKPGGRILLIEYRGEDPTVRIKPLHKTTVAQLTREMLAGGFVLEERIDKFPIQHFLLFKKKA
jgi:precorrin-6B methylase 2